MPRTANTHCPSGRPGTSVTLAVALLAAGATTPASALVVTQDDRGAAVQISGAAPAASVPFFSDADAAFSAQEPVFDADLAVALEQPAIGASAMSWQSSALSSAGGLLVFDTSGAVGAAGYTGDPGDTLLAAAVSNATLAFSIDAVATLSVAGAIAGSGLADGGDRFGLTAVTLVRGSDLIVALDSDGAQGGAVDLGAMLAPGDYVLTIVASTSATVLPGTGPVTFDEAAGYELTFTVMTVPLPGALGLLLAALSGLVLTPSRRRNRISGASC